jgi:ATP-binding cassette subfamily F protein uup
MMDRVCTTILGLDGLGKIETFADYSQWEEWQRAQQTARDASAAASRTAASPTAPSPGKKKLSYLEAREHAAIESRIVDAEKELKSRRAALEDPAIASDAPRLQAAMTAVEEARQNVDQLYTRWAELEEKKG